MSICCCSLSLWGLRSGLPVQKERTSVIMPNGHAALTRHSDKNRGPRCAIPCIQKGFGSLPQSLHYPHLPARLPWLGFLLGVLKGPLDLPGQYRPTRQLSKVDLGVHAEKSKLHLVGSPVWSFCSPTHLCEVLVNILFLQSHAASSNSSPIGR